MEWFDVDISPVQATLQETPDVLHPVGVKRFRSRTQRRD
jgi:hypothetical protein